MTTPRGAPELASAQALPETTVNEQIRRTEAGAGRFAVADRVTAPPGTCADGAVYLIISAATGDFTGKEDQLATAVGANAASGWLYRDPGTLDEGIVAYVQDEDVEYLWDGSAWGSVSSGGYAPGGTDVALADGGTGASLTDPNADRILFWDDSASAMTWLTPGTNISISGTTLNASGGGGSGSFDLSTEYTSTAPSAPATGLALFDLKRPGTHHLAARSPLAIDELQKALFTRTFKLWQAAGSTTPSTIGMNRSVISGASFDSPASTNIRTRLNRIKFQTAGSAGAQAGEIETLSARSLCVTSGFLVVMRWSHSLIANSGFRSFMGLSTSTSPGNVDPSSLTDIAGFGSDAGDSNYQFFHNDASGTATKVDLGANFPAATNDVVYEGRFFIEPGGATLYYSLERFDSAQFVEGSVSTDLPTAATMLGHLFWVGNGAVAANANIEVNKFYAEALF